MKSFFVLSVVLPALVLPWLYGVSTPYIMWSAWPQSEPVVWITCGLAFMICAGLLAGGWRYPHLVRRTLLHPSFLALGGIGFLLVLLSPVHSYPFSSWWGSPEGAEGAVYYLALWLVAAAYGVLWRVGGKLKRLALVNGLAAMGGLLALVLFHPFGRNIVPYYFPDYLAFFAIPAAVFTLFLPWGKPWLRGLLALGGAATFIGVSDNKIALIAGIGALLFMVGIRWLERRGSFGVSGRALAGALAAGLVGIAVFVLFSQPLVGETMPGSIRSRLYIAEALAIGLEREPARLLTGFGAGSYPDVQIQYFPLETTGFNRIEGRYFWEGAHRHHFHTHNHLLELLMAGGILTFGLGLAFYLGLLRTLKAGYYAAGLAVIGYLAFVHSFWFQMPVSWPLVVAALGLLVRSPLPWPRWQRGDVSFWLTRGLLGISALVFLWSFIATGQVMARFTQMVFPPLEVSGQCPDIFQDNGWGRWHFARTMRSFSTALKANVLPPEGKETAAVPGRLLREDQIRRLLYMTCLARTYIETERASPRLILNLLNVHTELALVFEPSSEPAARLMILQELAKWPQDLDVFLTRVPARVDMAAPYFIWLLNRQEFVALDEALTRYQGYEPSVITDWFSGLSAFLNPASSQTEILAGFARMKAAYEAGVESYVPVDESLKQVFEGGL